MALQIEERKQTDIGEEMVVNMGPQHPSTHGVLRLRIVTDGEIITQVTPYIGYLHRCFEKHAESIDYAGVIPYCDRMDYLAAINNELGFCLAVEKLMDLEIPERATWLRMITAELNRIASHLLAIGTFGLDLGSITPFMHCFRDREKILDLLEEISGARLLYNYVWVGGVGFDMPEGWADKVRAFLDYHEKKISDLDKLLTDNSIFIQRTADTGVLPADLCLRYGMSGPNIRGAGEAWDVRVDEPYCFYDQVEFDVITGKGTHGPLGSNWDRFYVRVQEMYESAKIVRQCLDRIPEGDPKSAIPRKVKPEKGEVYMRTETPRGELAYYIIADGKKDVPYRVKVKSPCFVAISCIPEVAPGSMIADAVATVGSLDIVLGEVDR